MANQFSFGDVRYSALNHTTRNKRLWGVFFGLCLLLALSLLNIQFKHGSTAPPASHCPSVLSQLEEKRKIQGTQWIVVTTINPPTDAMELLCNLEGWNAVVVADTKSPKEWKSGSCVYLSVEEQQCLQYSVVDVIPYRAYTRKNIGYLWAIQQGAKKVFDTDDDNLPTGKEIFVESPTGGVVGYRTDNTTGKSINIYSHFGRPDIWPRGFPLDDIDIRRPVSYMTEYESLPEQAKNVLAPPMLVQQGLADLDPDVDAIFRLTQVQELTHAKFCKKSPSIRLSPGTFCPFNSQNTLFSYDALWGLLLPITVSFRVCDIWRGYWVQRLLWDVNGTLGFTKPTVDQIRNAHNYLDDYKDELQIYDQTTQLIDYLASWTSSSTDLSVRIVDLMQGMSKHGFVEQGDVDLARRWVEDLKSVGYVFPTVTRYEPENHKAAVKANEEPRQNRQKSRQVANQALEQCQAEANVDPTMSKIQITGTGPRGETLSAFKDVLLVVNFNHPTYAALEPFLSIYSAYFPNIKVYGPEVPENLKDVVTEIKYDKGWASYHTLADAIEKNPGHKGYMFTNDDALLNVYQLAVYDLDKVWKAVPDPVKDVHDLSKAPPDDWIQWGRPETRPMWADPASFTAEQRARIEKYSGVKGPINVRSFADAAYVPGRIAKELAGVLNNFYKYGVFLEHGLGLGLIASEPTDNWISWNETYLWYDGSRPRWREFLKPGLDMLHPVKFADDPKAKETILDWIETVEVIPQ